MSNSDPLGVHAGLYQNKFTEAETNQFTADFDEITRAFAEAMQQNLSAQDEYVQSLVARHYAFVSKFWMPTKEAYKSLAMSYILPSPYKETYEAVATGLGKYHYDAIVIWADNNL